jgi:hypothetical protein
MELLEFMEQSQTPPKNVEQSSLKHPTVPLKIILHGFFFTF